MNRDAILGRPVVGVFAVVRPEGRVHATPLWFSWDGETVNVIVERDSTRHRWVVRAGRAAICIEAGEPGESAFASAEGRVTVVDPLSVEQRYELIARYPRAVRRSEVV